MPITPIENLFNRITPMCISNHDYDYVTTCKKNIEIIEIPYDIDAVSTTLPVIFVAIIPRTALNVSRFTCFCLLNLTTHR